MRPGARKQYAAAVSCSPMGYMFGGVKMVFWLTGKPPLAWHQCMASVHGNFTVGWLLQEMEIYKDPQWIFELNSLTPQWDPQSEDRYQAPLLSTPQQRSMQYFLHFQCHSTHHAVYNPVTLLGGKNLLMILSTALCGQKDVRRKEHEQTQRWYKKEKKGNRDSKSKAKSINFTGETRTKCRRISQTRFATQRICLFKKFALFASTNKVANTWTKLISTFARISEFELNYTNSG